MSKPNPSTNRIAPVKLWAVVDGSDFGPFDFTSSRAQAKDLLNIRQSAAFPRKPTAKWRIARVEIREVK